jgi:homoserine dehydrogenase
MKIALIGFGTVGQGLAQILRDQAAELRAQHGFQAEIVAVATRSRGSLMRAAGLDPAALLDAIHAGSLDAYPDAPGLQRGWSSDRIARDADAEVLVEASPSDLDTGGPALALCYAAFASGKHVVLANKGPVVVAYAELMAAAHASGKRLLFEATVMAGTPSLRLALEALAGVGITRARGIINGTTNYILTQMETGMPFDDALAQAQALGYAEADPTADVDGWDAAGKARIVSAALFGRARRFDEMTVEGIRGLTQADIARANDAGERWKLIADITPDALTVAPARIPLAHPLAGVSGGTNAITYSTALLGDVTLVGAGAGGIQTGFGLLGDLLALHRHEV